MSIFALQQAADTETFSGFDYRSAIEDALELELERFHVRAGGSAQFVGAFEGDAQLDDLFETALGQTPAILFRVASVGGGAGRSSRKSIDVNISVEVFVFSNHLQSMEKRQRRQAYALLAELRSFLLGRDIKANTQPFIFGSESMIDRGERGGSLWMQIWQTEAAQERGVFPDSSQSLESVEARNEQIDSTNPPATRVTTLSEN